MICIPKTGGIVYHGDGMDILRSLPSGSIDMVLTDPPYGIRYMSNLRKRGRHDAIVADDNLDWLPSYIKEISRVAKPDTGHYMFCSWRTYSEFFRVISGYFTVRNLLVWCKNNHGAGDLMGSFAPKHELIIFFTKGRPLRRSKRVPDVLHYNKVPSDRHPTEKPTDLLSLLIEQFSDPSDVILDTFSGTGSTGVAAKNLGRRYILSEVVDKYYGICLERLKDGADLPSPVKRP